MTATTPRGEFGVLDVGPQDAPTVLLLHPLASAAELWRPLAEEWSARDRRVLAIDARGHGRSSWDGRPFTVAEMAEDAASVLDELALRDVGVLGVSMGGCTAQALALDRPDLVGSLVLVDSTSSYGPDRVALWEQRAQQAEGSERADLLGFQLTRWFTDAFREAQPDVAARVSEIFTGTTKSAHAAASRALGAFEVTDRLGQITVPTLVLVGEEDYATPPEMSKTLHAGIPDSRLVVLPDARHLSMVESRQARALAEQHLFT
jgi:3-oxoadipate enol-lactonase